MHAMAAELDLLQPYQSPLLDKVSAEFKLAPNNEVSPVDYGDVCINYENISSIFFIPF